MSTRGFEHVTMADISQRELRQALKPKGSKHRNVKTVHDGIVFASKREADRYVDLRVRLKAGEIRGLRMQVAFPLLVPVRRDSASAKACASYVADFVYLERVAGAEGLIEGEGWVEGWLLVVEDAKGQRTQMYQLKKKWLELQDGITIREV